MRLASDLSLPAITKDGIKEAMLDQFDGIGRELSERIGRGSWAVLWHLLEVELRARQSALFEGNFSAEYASSRVKRLLERFEFAVLQPTASHPSTFSIGATKNDLREASGPRGRRTDC